MPEAEEIRTRLAADVLPSAVRREWKGELQAVLLQRSMAPR